MPYLLPEKYNFIHNYCFFLHDQMAKIIKNGETKRHFDVKINPKVEEQSILSTKQGEALYQWMIENGYKDEADLLTYKQIFVATLSDLLQFIFTSLRSSEKAHLSVTYALLRKPLKDNLFILERLLSTPNEFINQFDSSESYKEIAIDNIQEKDKIKIIKDVGNTIPFNLYPAEFIYSLRYSKKEIYGLEQLWQKAAHIVTSCIHYRTEPGNLNFVFSSFENKLEQWDYLYFILPVLLLYTLQVCFTIYYVHIAKDEEISDELMNRIIVGQIICNRHSINQGKVNFNDLLAGLELKCRKCCNTVKYTEEVDQLIINKWYFKCQKGHRNFIFELN